MKTLFYIVTILISIYSKVYTQETLDDDFVQSKFKLIQKFSEENNPVMIVITILDILEYDPQNIVAIKQLNWSTKIFFDLISKDEELLERVLLKIKNPCALPLLELSIYNYGQGEIEKAKSYLLYLIECKYYNKKLKLNSLLELNNKINPKLYNEIIEAAVNSIDSSYIPICTYLYFQSLLQNKLPYSDFYEILNTSKENLSNFFITGRLDTIQSILYTNPNYNEKIFDLFLKTITPEETNFASDDFDYDVLNFTKLVEAYKSKNSSKIQSIIEIFKNSELLYEFSIDDFLTFLELQAEDYHSEIVKILLDNLKVTDDYIAQYPEKIYAAIKKLYALNYKNECYKLYYILNKDTSYVENATKLIPLLFTKYFIKDSTSFKKLTIKFFLLAEREDIDTLYSELNYWSKLDVKITLFDKLIKIYNEIDLAGTNLYLPSEEFANYHALLIGIQDYELDLLDLKYPEHDVSSLRKILKTLYNFPEQNIISLINPSRNQIIKSFSDLKKLGKEDNLFIFYAGHGNWDDVAQQGYWLPADSKPNDLSTVITNSEITSFIKALKAKHVLLISDACFSGSIFKTRDAFFEQQEDISFFQTKKARKAITSGALTPVPDKSVFVEFLLKALRLNSRKYLTSEALFLSFREAVTNNSPLNQRPLFGQINNTGDEGGDFVFIRK